MNYLFAKLRINGQNILKVGSHQNDIVSIPDLANEHLHEFSADYKLDDEEWFYIENFSNLGFPSPFFQELNTADYNQLTGAAIRDVDYICIQQHQYSTFQKIGESQFHARSVVLFSQAIGDAELKVNQPVLVFHKYPDAIFDRHVNRLYFRQFIKLSALFDGIINLYRDATDGEVNEFFGQDFVQLGDDYSAEIVKQTNRKRILLAMNIINNFNDQQIAHLFDYARDYCPELPVANEQFIINSASDLKMLLDAVQQRFFRTAITDEMMAANSVRPIRRA